jgi:hypothetical protein
MVVHAEVAAAVRRLAPAAVSQVVDDLHLSTKVEGGREMRGVRIVPVHRHKQGEALRIGRVLLPVPVRGRWR